MHLSSSVDIPELAKRELIPILKECDEMNPFRPPRYGVRLFLRKVLSFLAVSAAPDLRRKAGWPLSLLVQAAYFFYALKGHMLEPELKMSTSTARWVLLVLSHLIFTCRLAFPSAGDLSTMSCVRRQ